MLQHLNHALLSILLSYFVKEETGLEYRIIYMSKYASKGRKTGKILTDSLISLVLNCWMVSAEMEGGELLYFLTLKNIDK